MIPELEAIKSLLLNEWDPIGIADHPGAVDEYDSYAMRAFVMLNSGADESAIFEYLRLTVTKWIGLPGDPLIDRCVAEKMIAIHKAAGSQPSGA